MVELLRHNLLLEDSSVKIIFADRRDLPPELPSEEIVDMGCRVDIIDEAAWKEKRKASLEKYFVLRLPRTVQRGISGRALAGTTP